MAVLLSVSREAGPAPTILAFTRCIPWGPMLTSHRVSDSEGNFNAHPGKETAGAWAIKSLAGSLQSPVLGEAPRMVPVYGVYLLSQGRRRGCGGSNQGKTPKMARLRPRLGRLQRGDLPRLQNLSVSEARALWELPSPSLATIGSRGINSPSLPATPLQPPHARTQTVNASTSRPGCLTQGKNSHAIAGSF